MTDTLLDPWVEALDEFPITGTIPEKLRALLRVAVLAPSGHNSQPWLFRINDDAIELWADRARALPVVDPDDRELVISCGAALAFLRVAMRHFGYAGWVGLFPDSAEPDLLARVGLGEERRATAADHAPFHAIAKRRTNRFPFEPATVPEPVLGRARAVAEEEGAWLQTLRGEEDRIALADLIAEGDRIQMADRTFRRELAAWVHANRSGSRDGMPGYAHGVGSLASTVEPLVIRTFDVGKGRAARDHELALGSPVLSVLWTEDDSARAWLTAGQALGRALLSLQQDGVSASYLNQPIEVPELRQRLREHLGRPGFPQIILRLGYSLRSVRPTPRRRVAEVVVNPASLPAESSRSGVASPM